MARKRRKRKTTKKATDEKRLERSFETYWIQLGDGTVFTPQHRGIFSHINKRKKAIMTRHTFDFAFVAEKIAVEMQGGIYGRGRHVRPIGYHNDRAKMRKAMKQGWLVLEYTTKDIDEDPASMIEEINSFLAMRRNVQMVLPVGERVGA